MFNSFCIPSRKKMAVTTRGPCDQLVWFRDMILRDTVALDKWSLVLVRLVTLPADQVRLSSQLREQKYEDAVLNTLQLWRSNGSARADLDRVFRDYGLVELADKCADIIQLLNPLEGAQSQQNILLRDVNWKPLNLRTGTLYAITSKATGFVYDEIEPLDMWKHTHWFEFREVEGVSNIYKLGTRKKQNFVYDTVQISQVVGSSGCFFIHPEACEDERPGLKYMSSRNDHLLKGNFAGLYEKSDGCGYDWDAFEFRFTPFVEYARRFYNINAKMTDFRFQSTPESFVAAYKKGTDTLEEHWTTNSVHGILFQTVTRTHRKESATINASETISASVRHFDSFVVNFDFKPSDVIIGLGESPVYKFAGDWSSNIPTEVRRWTCPAGVTGRPCLPIGWVENLAVEYVATVAVSISDKFDGTLLPEEKSNFILEKLGFKEPFAGVGNDMVLNFTTRGLMTTSFPLTNRSNSEKIETDYGANMV